jgi:membrane protease YdiL (CAAX protease family)
MRAAAAVELDLEHGRDARAGSHLRQTRARMQGMTSRLQRAVSRLLDSSPNYVEITALLATALAGRLLSLPVFWKVSSQACVAVALFVSILVYACVDRGQLFAYFGWVDPRRRIFWLCALIAGAAAAALVIAILHAEHTPLGHTSPATLLYGVTIGPIIEEILFRGCRVFRHLRDRCIDQGVS